MKCKNCNKNESIKYSKYSNGNFCSRLCANGYSTKSKRNEINIKISNALKGRLFPERTIDKVSKNCPVCKNKFLIYPKSPQIFCSKKCSDLDTNFEFKKKPNTGGYRKGSGRGKSGWFNGYWCDSSYELAWVIYHTDKNIKFKRNTKKFKYIFQNEEHYYLPDFIKDGIYYEIKGYNTTVVQEKIKQFPLEIKILYKSDLKCVFDYVINKYGTNYIKLYEGNPHNKRNNKCLICSAPAKNKYCSRKCSGKATKLQNNYLS